MSDTPVSTTSARKQVLTMRFNDDEMNYIKYMARETGENFSQVVRSIIFDDLDECKRGVVKYFPPHNIRQELVRLSKMTGYDLTKVVDMIIMHYFIMKNEVAGIEQKK